MTEMTVEKILGKCLSLKFSEVSLKADLQSLIDTAKQEERERCVAVVEEIWGAHKECDCYGPRDAIIAIQALKEQP